MKSPRNTDIDDEPKLGFQISEDERVNMFKLVTDLLAFSAELSDRYQNSAHSASIEEENLDLGSTVYAAICAVPWALALMLKQDFPDREIEIGWALAEIMASEFAELIMSVEEETSKDEE
jgi:hypothetical protein